MRIVIPIITGTEVFIFLWLASKKSESEHLWLKVRELGLNKSKRATRSNVFFLRYGGATT